jgi:2-oxoglutarate ferredoxin oxidoreductase subunit alpha
MADTKKLIQGNKACTMGAIKAGVRFCASYPITPASEIGEILSEELPKVGGKFIQMEDEIASMGAVIGSSVMGVKAITATSGAGFDLKQENIAYAAMTEIPVVIVDVQRSGPSTGGATVCAQGDLMQVKYGRSGDCPMIVLYPNSVKEIYKTTIRAFNLSEKYMSPVILLMDETIGHMRENIDLSEYDDIEIINRKRPDVSPEEYKPYEPAEDGIVRLMPFGNKEGYRYVIQGMHHGNDGMPNLSPQTLQCSLDRINGKLDRHKEDIWEWEEIDTKDADIIVVAVGCVSRSATEAVREMRKKGIKAGLFRPITLWPFPDEPLQDAMKNAKAVIVPEMNMGQLVHKVREYTTDNIKVVPLNIYDGTVIMPEQIENVIEEVNKK